MLYLYIKLTKHKACLQNNQQQQVLAYWAL